MQAADEMSGFLKKAAGDFPLTPGTLYWRVYMSADRHLKLKTVVASRHHDSIAKFFAILWRYFFENKTMDYESGSFNFPFDASVITPSQLASVNGSIDSELREMMAGQEGPEQGVKITNIMRMGDIGLKIKKIITHHAPHAIEPDDPLNDNQLRNTSP